MKILLVHPEIRIKYGSYGYQAGMAALSASLKKADYTNIEFLHLTRDIPPDKFRKLILDINPTIVGFYTTFNQYRFIYQYLSVIPNGIFTILGGPHPTIYPKCLEETPRLDAICIGEGDQSFVELVNRIQNGESLEGVSGVVYRAEKDIHCNSPRPFITNLDELPFEDREIFRQSISKQFGLLEIGYQNSFRLGRGCPFQCSFCSNHSQSKAQPGKYVRFRSTAHIIAEIEEVVGRYHPTELFFQDDTFMSSVEAVEEFCEQYGKKIGIPFSFFGRIELVSNKLLRTIRDAGGIRVSYGVESGDEEIREKVLRKRFSNRDVKRVFQITKELGIVAEAFVMVGFPGETVKSFQRTAELLQNIQPDIYTLSTYFPNPGTDLYDLAKKEGYLRYESVPSHLINQRAVMLNLPEFPPKAIASARRWFAFRVYGRKAPVKALMFFLYESILGDFLLRLVSPFRKRFRRWILS